MRVYLPSAQSDPAMKSGFLERIGYRGERRRILIVDNEQVDRQLLANVLEPRGFQIAQAASGQECLDLLPGFDPDAIFMDLAMPGMDGWETIRRIRDGGMGNARICILSANAFEKNVDDLFGISRVDFIVKPFRVEDLLDWLGEQLSLDWLYVTAPPQPVISNPPPPPEIIPPDALHLAALREMVEMGYMRGIRERIDVIEGLDPAHAEFVRIMRALVDRFQFEPMKAFLRKYSHGTD